VSGKRDAMTKVDTIERLKNYLLAERALFNNLRFYKSAHVEVFLIKTPSSCDTTSLRLD